MLGITHVLEADNGQAAIEIVRQYTPDVVILDLDIPKINGLDVIPRLKASHPAVRILVISGQDQNTFAPRARQAGAHGFVSKTQELGEIVRCTESVLAGYTVMPEIDHGNNAARPTKLRAWPAFPTRNWWSCRCLPRACRTRKSAKPVYLQQDGQHAQDRVMENSGQGSIVDVIDFARRHHIAIG